MPQIIAIVAALGLGLALLGGAYLFGMRAKSRWVQGPIIWFSRRFANPRQMRTAGTPGAYASIIRAPGRVSGQPRETPVGAVRTDDGFLIALPYGTRPHWLRNVLASGHAALVHEGETYAVDSPEIVPMSAVEPAFSRGDQRTHRLFRVDQCLRLRAPGDADDVARAA